MQDNSTAPVNPTITQELYKKNVDLVNANKTLELIEELYNIMITNYTVGDVSQKFIDTICSKLGFLDGLVVIIDKSAKYLNVIGITQTELNRTILDRLSLAPKDIAIPLEYKENVLVKTFNSRQSSIIKGISNIWTPILKTTDIMEMSSISEDTVFLVYPIVFGEKIIGAYCVSLPKEVESLTEFETNSLNKLATVFGIAIDRTRINQELTESEERELAKAKELLKLKDEFVFIATHDLRTPVTAIDGYISLIDKEKPQFSADIEKNFMEVKAASDRLKQLVDDLLQVARGESGTIKVEVAPVNINEIIEKVKNEVQPAADTKKVNLILNFDKETYMVLGDSEKLPEVIENLMSNAIKFNRPDGSVTITTKKVESSLQISVADTGYGIPKEEQPKVFEKFFKYRGQETRDVTGTGLGLFVVRMLIEKMNGKITFTSDENKGTTFNFILPLAHEALSNT